MTIRGTSNHTGLTRSKSRLSVGIEIGPGDDEGGAFAYTLAGITTYREVDNSAGSSGMLFTKGSDHLPVTKPQADRQPVVAGVDLDDNGKPDTVLGIDQVSGKPVLTEDEDSYNVDVDGDGEADFEFPKE